MEECKAVFADSALLYDGPPTMTLLGLSHLEGELVTVWADGELLPSLTVINGRITLPREASKAAVGLGYNSQMETMPIEMEDAGSLRGRKQRASAVTAQIFESFGGEMGAGETTLDPMTRGNGEGGLFTGDVRRNIQGGTRDRITVKFSQSLPAPFTVLASIVEMEVFE